MYHFHAMKVAKYFPEPLKKTIISLLSKELEHIQLGELCVVNAFYYRVYNTWNTIPACISNHMPSEVRNEIIFHSQTSMVWLLKFGNGLIISSHIL